MEFLTFQNHISFGKYYSSPTKKKYTYLQFYKQSQEVFNPFDIHSLGQKLSVDNQLRISAFLRFASSTGMDIGRYVGGPI